MKVSVITATYNSEKNIERCIESVNSQTYQNLEHVFVDGLSSDRTILKIEKSCRSNLLISEPDNGIYNALNKGVKLASGELIIFLHSDDVFKNHHVIEKLVEPFRDNEDIVGVYGNIQLVKINRHQVKVNRTWKSKQFNVASLAYGWMPPHTGLMVSKSIFSEVGYFNESFKISGDYEFLLRFLMTNPKIEYIDVDITEMQMGGVSTALKYIQQKLKEDVIALKANNFRYPYLTALWKRLRKLRQYGDAL